MELPSLSNHWSFHKRSNRLLWKIKCFEQICSRLVLDATTQPGRNMFWCTAPKQKCRRQSLNTLSESRAAGQNGTSDDLRVSERPSAARKKHAACPWRCLCKNWCEHKARNRVARTRDQKCARVLCKLQGATNATHQFCPGPNACPLHVPNLQPTLGQRCDPRTVCLHIHKCDASWMTNFPNITWWKSERSFEHPWVSKLMDMGYLKIA